MSSEDTNPESESVFCTSCGAEISANTSFCSECGTEQGAGDVAEKESDVNSENSETKGYRHRLPGISNRNTTRRNVLIGGVYSLVGLGSLGVIAGDPEENNGDNGSAGGSESSNDGSNDGGSESSNDGSSDGESYPNAFYYDDSTGIVFEDDVEAEADQIGSLYIRGTVRNESGNDYEYVQIMWSVLDGSGTKIADALANTSGLKAGQSWRYEALAASADGVESYELQDIEAY